MPAYYYHLKLEVYKSPAIAYSNRRQSHGPKATIHLPSATTNIFRSALPTHRISKWVASANTDRSPDAHRQTVLTINDTHGKALLLPERNLFLNHAPLSPSLRPARPSNDRAARDWRYGLISIDSVDMEPQKSSSTASVAGLHTKAKYVPSDTRGTDIGWGVVHLYRDAEENEALQGLSTLDKKESFDHKESTTLCILAVPSWMMPSDLLGFVGEQAHEDVSHFRLIRTGRANKYMALMKFRSAKKAQDWQKENNGRLFSAAEPENCHVVFVKSVEFVSPDVDMAFPNNSNDPFTALSTTSKPLAPPPPDLNELPTCPVCLERMDETTGLLTILCQHVFHCACLEKWRGSGCPVCRYTHAPSYTFPYPRPHNEEAEGDNPPMCSVCATTNNVWVCLICGNLGCGRYDAAHAHAHYESTSHCYAMDIDTQRVWDYAGDGYVHRLIQSKPDARAIELPAARTRHENEAFRVEGSDSVPREKMESMATEYTYLLTSQLEGQRRYFEEQVERAADKASQASSRTEQLTTQLQESRDELETKMLELKSLQDALITMEKTLDRSQKAREKFEQMSRAMSSALREEKLMNEGLLKRMKLAEENTVQARMEAAKAIEEKKELEDMNNDLTMFISSQEKVKELQAQGEEVAEGGSGLVEGPSKTKKKGRKR